MIFALYTHANQIHYLLLAIICQKIFENGQNFGSGYRCLSSLNSQKIYEAKKHNF